MFFEVVHQTGLSHMSYIIGGRGKAVVIDPRRDCEIYIDIARRHDARIIHIFETHRNEDYLSGSVDLARFTGAEIYHGRRLPFKFGNPVRDGEVFHAGSGKIIVLETPGHTDESISLAFADTAFSTEPIAVFTGDTIFVGGTGRTDFYPERAEEMAGMLYDSITEKLLALGNGVIVHPAHSAGSLCGAGIAAREFSTIGYERMHNPVLRASREQFIRQKLDEQHYKPPYFQRMHALNLQGRTELGRVPKPSPMNPDEFAAAIQDGMYVLDVRSAEAYSGASIPGSQAMPQQLIGRYAGWHCPYDRAIGLVAENETQAGEAVVLLLRMGYDSVKGCLAGSMNAWEKSGREFQSIPGIHIYDVLRRIEAGEEFLVLDVRTKAEFDRQHLPNAVNMYVGTIQQHVHELPENMPLVTFCGSGRRAMVAASILKQHGFSDVRDCLGSASALEAVEGRTITVG